MTCSRDLLVRLVEFLAGLELIGRRRRVDELLLALLKRRPGFLEVVDQVAEGDAVADRRLFGLARDRGLLLERGDEIADRLRACSRAR